jgi:hypothetical protein
MLRMTRYFNSRFWAIWDEQDLVAVVVYKRGAQELLRRLQAQAPATAAEAAARPTAHQRPARR